MAPRRARPAAETDAPASEVDVRLYTLADAEEGKARDDDDGGDDDDDDDDDDALTADPVRLPGTGEIDAAASATMSRIARVASRALDPLDAHEVDDSDSDGDSSSSDADRSDVDDPVADATMERIFATSRATPHDDAHDRSCDTRKNEEHVTRSDRATLESEMRKLRDERIAERAVSNGGGGGGGGGNGGGSGASSSDGSFRDLGPLATVAEDGDDHRREERADVAEETRRRTARAREDGGGGARGGGGGDVVARKRLASRSPASFVGLSNFFNAGGGGSSNNASYSSVTSIGGGDGHSKHSPTQNPLPADVPVIRLRRTSSYFVADGSTGASSKLSSSICGCDGLDGGGGVSTEDIMRKRRNELITYRLRVAGFGKLCVTLLAGVLAGVVMWAMTTVTAKLTQLKFDKTRALLSSEDVATAWAYYAGVAMASVGATAFTVLHPRGCPMARGSGIPELKGYLNGNRQRGLFHWRTFLGRSVGVCLVIVATMPFGREGPSVHIGACVASMSLNLPWRKYLGWQPSPEERRQILQLGSAAGVAGAFNAPIGGLLYVMEEIASTLPPDYVWRAMITAGMAVGVAQVLYSANEGRVDYTSLVISDPNSSTGWDMSEIPLIVVLAVLAGALSALFTVAADFFGSVRRGKVRWVPTKMRAFLASKHGQLIDAVLSAALVASCQILIPLAYSCRAAPGEYDPYDPSTEAASGAAARSLQTVIQIPRTFVPYTCADGEFSEMATLMLQNEEGVVKHLFARDELYSEKLFTAPVVAAFLAYFFVIASVTTGGAFPAGVFIPNMLMGAALGRLFGFLAEWVTPAANKGTYALIGSAAMLSGFSRMTAAVTVIMIEVTSSLDVLAPIILSCIVARFVAQYLVGHNLDERLILAKGVPFLEHDAHPSTASTRIGDALAEADKRRGPVIAFRPQERLQVLLNALLLTDHNAFPVLDDVERNTGIGGLVTRAMLQRVLRIVLENSTSEEGVAKAHDDDAEEGKDGLGPLPPPAAERAAAPMPKPRGRSWFARDGGDDGGGGGDATRGRRRTRRSFEDWSVEGFEDRTSAQSPPPARRDRRAIETVDADAPSPRASAGAAGGSSNANGGSSNPNGGSGSAAKKKDADGDFMRTVARWTRAHSTAVPRSCHPTRSSSKCGGSSEPGVATRVGAAAAASGGKPTVARADDSNHFDELKEGLVAQIREGVKHVPNEQLSRMVDLTHAVDKAPWTVDAAMKLARVHALFSRLGVRHLCVTSRGGNKLEGIITRHDLIHVHRRAQEH